MCAGRGRCQFFACRCRATSRRRSIPGLGFFNPVGSQVGLVNIELGQSSNPAVEEEVLTDVASYGKQLGRIEDALVVLLAHFRPERRLTAKEELAINDLNVIVTEIAAVKAKHQRRVAS